MSDAPADIFAREPQIDVRALVEGLGSSPLVVAIPANNEADRIGACLSALAMQRDETGDPLPPGTFDVLLLANNCSDATVLVARSLSGTLPYTLIVVEKSLTRELAHAGHARKIAMDEAADRLDRAGQTAGVILTTDADSRVAPTWISATLKALSTGVECVAGYIDAEPSEIVGLGAAFLRRGRLEDRYLRLIAEIEARCDPRPHDPWPNHRVSSGASLAVTLQAYRAIGGLPAVALGEDAALTRRLEAGGFRTRHALDVIVTTSCRLQARAAGGAADTMLLRHTVPDSPCDADLEPARAAVRRARLRRLARRAWTDGDAARRLARRAGLEHTRIMALARRHAGVFLDFWTDVEAASPALARPRLLRPSDLPVEIRRAERWIALLGCRALSDQPVEMVNGVMNNGVLESMAGELVHE